VGAEIDDRPPDDDDFSIRADAFDNQVLEVGGREQFGEVLDESDQPVLAHAADQLLHGGNAHSDLSDPFGVRATAQGISRGPLWKRGYQTKTVVPGQGESEPRSITGGPE